MITVGGQNNPLTAPPTVAKLAPHGRVRGGPGDLGRVGNYGRNT